MSDTKATLAFRCVDLVDDEDVQALQDMVGRGREISFETFASKVDCKELAASMGYATERGHAGMRLENDRCVEFCSGKWKGETVYYLVHSAIEFVFRVQRNDQVIRPVSPWHGQMRGNTAAAARRRTAHP